MDFQFEDSYTYENGFYLTAKSQRMARILAHYELYKKCITITGDIIDCGVFKGASFMRFIMFMQLFDTKKRRKIIGFDTFDHFPPTDFERDKSELNKFIKETDGGKSIRKEELEVYLKGKNFSNFELIKGDILNTVPIFVQQNPSLRIALLNIDTDIYEPAKVIIEYLAPKVVKGGVIIFDDYGVFAGETQVADDYCKKYGFKLQKFSFSNVPSYLIKE